MFPQETFGTKHEEFGKFRMTTGNQGKKHVALRARYPIRARKIVKKRFLPFTSLMTVWIAGAYLILVHTDLPRRFGARWELLDLWHSWVALLFLGLVSVLGAEIIYFIRYFYDVVGDNVIIRKGIFAQTEVTLPLSKITDVFMDQDTLDVIFGLYDVHISTPTAESGRFAHIDGLNRQGATEIRRLILERMNQLAENASRGSSQNGQPAPAKRSAS